MTVAHLQEGQEGDRVVLDEVAGQLPEGAQVTHNLPRLAAHLRGCATTAP